MHGRRARRVRERYANVDGIPFRMPVATGGSPTLMAAYSIDADAAAAMLPGQELHPLRLGRRGVLVVAVVDYQDTTIGQYVEMCIGIACSRGWTRPLPVAPALAPFLFGTGLYIYDLPVSSEISVKGGLGIWGMPKRPANLDFVVGDDVVSSQYDLDGECVLRIDVARPSSTRLPFAAAGQAYGAYRGMLTVSYLSFRGRMGVTRGSAAGRLLLGDSDRAAPLKSLDIAPRPMATVFATAMRGVLHDHVEMWFLTADEPPSPPDVGLREVVDLALDQTWLPPPDRSRTDRLLATSHEVGPS